jgi:tape measure domain-containing protein
MAGDNRVQITISANAADAKTALADVRRQLHDLGGGAADAGRSMESFGGSLGSVKGLLSGLGVAAVATQFTDFGVAVIDTSVKLESLALSFKAIKGSSAGAASEMRFVANVADRLGLNLVQTAESYKLIAGAAKGTVIEGAQTRAVFESVARASAALGLSADNTKGILLALGQIMSKGTVQAEEVRGQLGERLPGAFQAAARAMGVTTAEFGKMMERGEVISDDFIPKFAVEINNMAADAGKMGDTLGAALNRSENAWTSFKSAVGDAGFAKLATKVLNAMATEANSVAINLRAATGALGAADKITYLQGKLRELDGKHMPFSAGGDGSFEKKRSAALRGPLEAQLQGVGNEFFLQSEALAEEENEKRLASAATKAASDAAAADQLYQKKFLEKWAAGGETKAEKALRKRNKAIWDLMGDFGMGTKDGKSKFGSGPDAGKKFQEMLGLITDDYAATLRGDVSANAAERADIKGSGVLLRVEDEIAALEESLGGNRLGASIAKIEREHNRALTQIRSDLVGAKGGVEDLRAAEERLGDLKALKIKQAQVKAYYQELDFWASNMSRVGELKNDPMMVYSGKLTKLNADIGKELESITGTAAAKAQDSWDAAMKASQKSGADTTAIWQGVADDWARIDAQRIESTRLLEERAQLERKDLYYKSLGDAAALDQGYFDHKRKLLDNEILSLRGVITNETALRTYASRKYSELARQELEARMDAQDSFLGYLGNYLSLEFGLYKDHTTRTREMWRDMAASSVQFLRQLGQELQTGLSEYITALFTNDSAKRERAWNDMLQRMLNNAARWVTDLAMMWARQQIFIPVVASIVGVDDSGLGELGLNIAGGQGKKSGMGMGDLAKYGGYAKDGYSMFKGGGSSWVSSIDNWGASTLGIGVTTPIEAIPGGAPIAAVEAAQEMGVTGSAVTGGLGSGLAAAGAGAAAGGLAGQIMRPDTYTPSLVGAGAGAAAGAAASWIPALGLSAYAGPVGMAVGLIAAAVASLATPETKKSSWGVPQASEPAVWIVDGQAVPASYGVIRTTSSGMFGSQSTTHKAIYDLANPAISAEVTAGMEAATAGLKAFSKSLGQSDAEFRETMKGANSMMIAIPEGYEQLVYRNLANLQAEHYLKQTGLVDQANALLRSGESYIDMIGRTETAATTAAAALGVVGLSLEQMSGSAERLVQGDWASRVIAVMGGADQFTAAMTRFNKWVYSSGEQAEHSMQYFGGKAWESIRQIEASGVTLQNFWGEYRQRMEAGLMRPEEFGQWARAAVWVEQAYTSAAQAAEQQTQAQQKSLQAMQATRQELVQQAAAWGKTRDSLRAFLHSMRTDQYTTLSPTANLAERQAKYFEVRAKARSGDLGAQDEFKQYAKDFREFAYDFYGANQEFVAIDQMIQADTSGLISLADAQLAATNEQIARLDAQILVSQQILASGTLVNDNLGRVAGAVEASGASIVGAISKLSGAPAVFDGGGQAAAIMAANQAAQSQYQALLDLGGGAAADEASSMWDGLPRFHGGGLVGDELPAVLLRGERVLAPEHSRMMERLAANGNVDTATLERLLAQLINAVANGNAAVAKLLARVESNTATAASDKERVA